MRKVARVTNPGSLMQAVFADDASVIRASESGLDLKMLGALGTAVRVGEGCPVLVYNGSGAIAYVAFGVQAMAAPSTPADGIPLADKEKMVLNSGTNAWIRASAATVYGYASDQE